MFVAHTHMDSPILHTESRMLLVVVKALPVTGRGGLQGCEMLRIPHFLDNRLTVNCEVLATCSSTYSPVRTSQEAHSVSIKQSYPRNRPWRPIGL
jgi:hypothetical protein